MHITLRDSTGTRNFTELGNTSPDFHLSMSHSFQWKRLNLYALVDGNYGNRLFNEEIHWSLGDFMVRYEDQDGKTVENADCFVKTSTELFLKMYNGEHYPGVGDFMSGRIKSNNPYAMKTFIEVFR